MAGIYKLKDHTKGDTLSPVTFTLSTEGIPIDITDCIIRMGIKTRKTTKKSIYELSTLEGTIEIVDAANGIFKLPSQIIDYPHGTYFYDIKIEFPNAEIFTWIEGTWDIEKNITTNTHI